MQMPSFRSYPEQEATMASYIFLIVLDHLALLDNRPDLLGRDHPLRPRHLTDRMR